jgi:hypothetical protein
MTEVARAFIVSLPALALPFVIRFMVVEGVATATEVSTIGIAYTIVIGLLVYRQFDWSRIGPMLVETASLSGVILLILGAATAMAWALTQSGFSQHLATAMTGLPGGRFTFMAASIVSFVVLGSVLEGIPVIVRFGRLGPDSQRGAPDATGQKHGQASASGCSLRHLAWVSMPPARSGASIPTGSGDHGLSTGNVAGTGRGGRYSVGFHRVPVSRLVIAGCVLNFHSRTMSAFAKAGGVLGEAAGGSPWVQLGHPRCMCRRFTTSPTFALVGSATDCMPK